jgi:hypothetical protein
MADDPMSSRSQVDENGIDSASRKGRFGNRLEVHFLPSDQVSQTVWSILTGRADTVEAENSGYVEEPSLYRFFERTARCTI